MSLKLILRPEAEADALEAYRWYSEQLPGLGDDFLSEVERAIETVQASPEANRKFHREFRRALTRRFRMESSTLFETAESWCSRSFIRHVTLEFGGSVEAMPANNALERTVRHRRPRLAAARCTLMR